MAYHLATERQATGLAARFLALFGLKMTNKQTLCVDRMAALDDPATRRALADLPAHLLLDIGAVSAAPGKTPEVEGAALRHHMW